MATKILPTPTSARAASPAASARISKPTPGPITLSIDIGGSGLKVMLLDAAGKPVSERQRVDTPAVPTPLAVLKRLDEMVKLLGKFNRVSAGFPGVIKKGCTWTAVNLHPKWVGFNLQQALEKHWKKPGRMANERHPGLWRRQRRRSRDDTHAGHRHGLALFTDGRLCPGLELGHHPWKKKTYEDYIGRRGLDALGKKKWNLLLLEAIDQTSKTFNWDHLYIGGGNTRRSKIVLPKNATVVSMKRDCWGGVALWREW